MSREAPVRIREGLGVKLPRATRHVPSDPPHVVRGYTGKAEKLHRPERYETPSGDTVHKQVFSESPMPIVRAVWPDGTIRTFSDQVGNDEAQFDDQQPEWEDE